MALRTKKENKGKKETRKDKSRGGERRTCPSEEPGQGKLHLNRYLHKAKKQSRTERVCITDRRASRYKGPEVTLELDFPHSEGNSSSIIFDFVEEIRRRGPFL